MSTDYNSGLPAGMTQTDILTGIRVAEAWFGRPDAPVCGCCELPASDHERPFGMQDVANLGTYPIPEDHGYEPDTDRLPGEVAESQPQPPTCGRCGHEHTGTETHAVVTEDQTAPLTVTLGGELARHLRSTADQLGWSVPQLLEHVAADLTDQLAQGTLVAPDADEHPSRDASEVGSWVTVQRG